MTVEGIVGAMHSVAIQEARACVWQVSVPDLVRIFRKRDPLDFPASRVVKEAKLDLLGVCRKQGEIDSLAIMGRPQWIGLAIEEP